VRLFRPVAALTITSLLAIGCSDRGGSEKESPSAPTSPSVAASADFGDLRGLCRTGQPAGAPAQGVTAGEIRVGVMSDVGFTKNAEFSDAAKVFTSWCNDNGGINGRKLVATARDTRMVEVRQRMIEACRDDFALVGGGAALDSMGVKDRLTCLLPDFPAQVVAPENESSDLQIRTQARSVSYVTYAGMYHWLLKEAYPASAGGVGLIVGDNAVAKLLGEKAKEGIAQAGGRVVYNDLYPAAGVSDWTPYAQSIKSKNVKGLLFYGHFGQLAKLEQALTAIDYRPDWIDANNNAYGPQFLELAGKQALAAQNNIVDLSGVHPLEKAGDNPATRQLVELYAKYAPGVEVTLPSIRAFSAWLIFAKAAASCGDTVTRKCVYDAAAKETAWTAGGLQAPVEAAGSDIATKCFNVERATPDGWVPADFKPDTGVYRCDAPAYKLTGDYPEPVTLADVGKSMADLG